MSDKLRGQRGTTLIELMVAMTISSLVIGALAGVVYAVTQLSNTWGARMSDAQQAESLPDALSADAARYAVCPTGGSSDGNDLIFCNAAGTPIIHYATPASCPCDVTRTVSWVDANGVLQTGGTQVVARKLVQRPYFASECKPNGSAAGNTGFLFVTGVQYAGDVNPQPLQPIFFRAPAGGCFG
jgi:prepilin-type N-terminal cleavage/methylation domain-containing protein